MPRPGLVALAVLLPLALAGCSAAAEPEEAGPVPGGVAAMYEKVHEEIREAGGETTTGDWRVGYVTEPAEPWFEERAGRQVFREPRAGETQHIEIIPFERSTGRIVPTVPIHVQVLARDGSVVDEQDLSFFYSEFFHYAGNFSVPEAGTYTIRATLDAPTFRRHGERADGPALAEGVTVTFADVELG